MIMKSLLDNVIKGISISAGYLCIIYNTRLFIVYMYMVYTKS